MFSKLAALIWREIYMTYTDRTLLLILLVTPLALATIIGAAFSGLIGSGGSDVPIRDIPVAVVNLDQGAEQNRQAIQYGQIYVDAFVPPTAIGGDDGENMLFELTEGVSLTDAEAARAAVRTGEYTAAIIIPADFSAALTAAQGGSAAETTIEVYASDAAPISANVIRSIVLNISNQLMTGNIAASATLQALFDRAGNDAAFGTELLISTASGNFSPDFASALENVENAVQIEQQAVRGEVIGFNPLVTLGAAQAVFFMTFTALGGVTSLIDERKEGTLPRLLMTPTPRALILIGKISGVFINCVIQVSALIVALAGVGIILEGEVRFIWGTNLIGLFAVVLSVAFAASGMGALVAGFARTSEQANVITTVYSLIGGVLGGAFFTVDVIGFLRPLTRLLPHSWAVDAFTRLSQNDNAIELNLMVLVLMGLILLSIGIVVMNRRMEA
jgi:ABC-2 type transport system permease protein